MRKSPRKSNSTTTPRKPDPAPKPRSPRASGRVTLSDVALAAGVSAMTVSRALRGEQRVKPELVQQIQQIARDMGYVPDPAARALASQKSNQVLVLVPLLSNALFVDVLESLHKELMAAGYYPVIGVTHYDPQEEEQLLRTYLPMRPAGLLITGFDHTPEVKQLLSQSNIPCVHMMELDPTGENVSVGFHQQEAGAAITQHLVDKGYQRIAFCAGQLDTRVRQRSNGWKQVLKAHKMYDPKLQYLWPESTTLELGAQMLTEVMRQDPSVDAIFFCNDDIARGALLEALRQGIKVPEQIAIVGFNDLTGSDQMVPPLTTIRTPRKAIGAQSAQLLLQMIRNEPIEQTQINLGYELAVRGSA